MSVKVTVFIFCPEKEKIGYIDRYPSDSSSLTGINSANVIIEWLFFCTNTSCTRWLRRAQLPAY